MVPAQIIRVSPKTEVPPETPDGIITIFSTTLPYVSGTMSVWLNGMRMQADLETGFAELSSTQVQMKEPPLSGDTIEVQYEAQ